jgi:MoxR-like ATPase
VTSNREKRLPEPFLRRCLYVRVSFPQTETELRDIVRKNTRATLPEINEAVLNAAVVSFLRVRERCLGHTQKPPTTSELIDWVRILHLKGAEPAQLDENDPCPPYWGTLFKTMADLDAYQGLAAAQGPKT